jgi:hypothetical protein
LIGLGGVVMAFAAIRFRKTTRDMAMLFRSILREM